MSQEHVLKFLKEYPDEWWTARQIGASIGITEHSCNSNIKRLIQGDFVHWTTRYTSGGGIGRLVRYKE